MLTAVCIILVEELIDVKNLLYFRFTVSLLIKKYSFVEAPYLLIVLNKTKFFL